MYLFAVKNLRRLLIISSLLLLCSAYLLCRMPPVIGDETMLRGLKVVLDPGHGGEDPGAVFGDILEKDIVLAIAFCIENELRLKGAEVVLTRREDRSLVPERELPLLDYHHDFEERKQVALNSGADLFLSIHANSFPESYCEGPQLFYEEESAPGKQLAIAIQEEMNRLLPNSRRFPRPIDQYVLRDMPLPSATVEVGFMSNDAELLRLLDQTYQECLAEAVVSGINLFLQRGTR